MRGEITEIETKITEKNSLNQKLILWDRFKKNYLANWSREKITKIRNDTGGIPTYPNIKFD
jgi:hypothetical protein